MVNSQSLQRDEEPIDVLVVEDNPGEARLLREAFTEVAATHTLHVVNTGQDALDYLNQVGEYESTSLPDLVILDLNLAKTDGISILEEVKLDSSLGFLPIVVLTSSTDRREIKQCYTARANAYLTKPSTFEELKTMVRAIDRFWFTHADLPPVST